MKIFILFLLALNILACSSTPATPESNTQAIDPHAYRVCYNGHLYCKQGENIYVQCSGAVQLGDVYPGTETQPQTCGDQPND